MKTKTSTFVKISLGIMALILLISIISLYVKLDNLKEERNDLTALLEEY